MRRQPLTEVLSRTKIWQGRRPIRRAEITKCAGKHDRRGEEVAITVVGKARAERDKCEKPVGEEQESARQELCPALVEIG